MPIQIIDNFELGAAKPLDNRFVVGPGQFYTDKSLIPNKYAGLRVWDLTGGSPGVPYVWDGTAWQTEASSGISGSGTPGYIPKFIGSGDVIDDSIIRELSGNIGIDINPTKKLHVNGDVQSDGSGGYYGIGTNLTALNATNITTGTLGLSRLQNGTSTYILTAAGSPTWTNPSSITVGNATNTVNVFHQSDTTTASGRKIPFINSSGASGNVGLRTAPGLSFKPSDITLLVGGGIGISTSAGTNKLKINSTTANTFVVDSNGNVGIGTNPSASYKLYVSNGNTYLSGNLRIIGTTQMSTGSISTLNFPSGSTSGLQISKIGSHYLRINSNSALSGIWFQNTTLQRSLYLDNNGDLITGGNSGERFENFRLENASSNGGNAFLYVRDKMGIGTLNFNYGGGDDIINPGAGSPTTGGWVAFSNGTAKLAVNGGIVGLWVAAYSDKRLKKDIIPIEKSLDKILKLKPVEYKWDLDNPMLNDEAIYYGFLAQDVLEILPESVRTFKDDKLEGGRLTLHYESFIAHLAKSIQEQQVIINDLEKRIKDLEG